MLCLWLAWLFILNSRREKDKIKFPPETKYDFKQKTEAMAKMMPTAAGLPMHP